MAANGTLKSSFSLPREKGPLGQNVSSLPFASSHREEHRITTNLNTHSGDEILKYMQSDVSRNTSNDEASDSQVSSSITSIQDAIAEMLTNIRASTRRQTEESSEKSVSSDASKTRNNKDQTTQRSNAKATDVEKTPDKGNKIKRPMNAFMVWAREYRQVLSKGFPKESNSQISVRLGDIWSNLTSEEKQPFYDKADRLRRQHEKDYPDWVYQPNKRRRTAASFPQTENRVVMATAGQIRGVLNSGNLGQNFQVQISPPIKAGQVHQPAKTLQVNSSQVSRQISGFPQGASQQVKSINISQSQPVSTNGPIHTADPQFQSPKRPATAPVNESPLAADKFHSLLSRYPMAKVLGKLSPEPQKRRSKSTFKYCKKQQQIKTKTPQQTKTRKKGKKPSPEKAPSKKVVHIRPPSSPQEPTKQAQQSWNCSGVPIGGVQTLVYSPYPTTAASMQVQNHAVPLLHQGQPIVQIPTPSQFVTAPPTGFMNMQDFSQQSTPRTFYHGNVMSPVSVVQRFPDPLTIRPDYSQPPPPLAIPVQPGVMMNMYPTRPLLPIMQDFKPTPHFPGQVVTFGPRLNNSNNKNNSNSEGGINAQNVDSNIHSNNNTNSNINNPQKVFSNTINNTANVSNNTNKSKFSNIKTTSNNITYTNTNINGYTSSSNNAQNVFNNAINNTTNVSNNNNTNKSKLRSNDTNSRNTTNTATNTEGNTGCSKNEQNFFSNTVNSKTNFCNNNTSNIKSSNESTNNRNIIYTNTNINGNTKNISSRDNAQKAFTNVFIGKINTSNTNTNNSNCSNIITSRTYNTNSSNSIQNVLSNTVNGKINLSNNTNNNNRSSSNNDRSYSINNARDVFTNTVNSTTNVGKNSTKSRSGNIINNNTANSTANASSDSNNSSSQKIDNLNTIPNYNSNANITNTSNNKASNMENTNNNFININMSSQSHNTVNCVQVKNEVITNIGDKTTMLYKVENGVTAQGSEMYNAAKQGETCNQSDNWMLQPPANPPTVRPNQNLNSQERDEKLNIIVELKQEDAEPAVAQKHHFSPAKENAAATQFPKPSDNSVCLAPLPPKKSFLQTLNTPMSSTDIVNQLTKLIRPPSLPYGATKKVPAPQASDDSSENTYKPPVGVPTDNTYDSASSTKLREPCPTGSSARILAQSSCEPTTLTQTSNPLQSESSPHEVRNLVSNYKDENFLPTIDHGNSVFQLTDYQSIPKKTQDSDPRPAEMNFSGPSSTSVAVLSSPSVAVRQQGGIIYINDNFSPVSLKKDGVPHHLLQSSYSSSSSDSSFQLPDHMKPIDLSIVSIDSDNSIPQGCEKFLLDMDSKEILVSTQGWDMTRCEVAKQGVGLGDNKMLVQLKKAHENFIGTVGGQLSPDDEVGS